VGSTRCGPRSFYDSPKRALLTSAGLGSMGFGYPARCGAKVAFPTRSGRYDGDGSFIMNVQNSRWPMSRHQCQGHDPEQSVLGMVMQWETALQIEPRPHLPRQPEENSTRAASKTDRHYPDTLKICEGFAVSANA